MVNRFLVAVIVIVGAISILTIGYTISGQGTGSNLVTNATTTPGAFATQTPSVSAERQTPTPADASVPTPAPVTQAPAPTPISAILPETITLSALVIAEVPSDLPHYDRDEWEHWVDSDGDCQDTRDEVLISESLVPVGFQEEAQCNVAVGEWLSRYDGDTAEVPRNLDIDHMVPLANAHRSGGWAWTSPMKQAYANDLTFEGHLIAVTASANRSKSDRGPEEWKPAQERYWCEYAVNWITIKSTWGLTATVNEWTALEDMLGHCTAEVVIEPAKEVLIP